MELQVADGVYRQFGFGSGGISLELYFLPKSLLFGSDMLC